MKTVALTLVFVLFSSGLGYTSMSAYGQVNQPCSVSHPCAKICGDHPCAPGETYTLTANQTTTVSASTNNTNTNQTDVSGMSTNVGIRDNVTATKNSPNMTTNATMQMSTNETMTTSPTNMTTSVNATTSTNMTMTSPNIMMPKEQVASGISPKDVKCESGLELIINQFNSRPACVKSDIASLLVERGWGMLAGSSP